MNYCQQSTPASSTYTSPSSSPILGPVDSSPLSSPHLGSYSLDSPPPTNEQLPHPFAGSTKGTKRPPHYEKKLDTPPCTPPGTLSRARGLYRGAGLSRSMQEDEYMNNDSFPGIDNPHPHRTSRYLDREERLWEDAIRKPFDTGIGHIDLSNQQLKNIPPSIGDLSSFFNTPELSEQTMVSGRLLSRVSTEPALESSRTRSFGRTQSIVDSGKERHVLQLYLAGNNISVLPPQLFTCPKPSPSSAFYEGGNQLTFIPPEICRLTNLRELNLSQNRLTYLPWEMRDMKLNKLMLYPNPFLPEPSRSHTNLADISTPREVLRSRRSATRLYSMRREAETAPRQLITVSAVTKLLAPVPPLTELCLRLLLSPIEGIDKQLVIAEYYGTPLSEHWYIPPNIHRILAECVPGILRPRKRFSLDTTADNESSSGENGTGTCPNPMHKGRFFVRHAAERFSWERRIAGLDVGGTVPLRWRGCYQSCLDFLDGSDATAITAQNVKAELDVEMDVDVEGAVRVVNLGTGGLDMDEFDG
ncbi:hypothetical protein F5I97DRAFT_1160361 [Phlebopus sp. FC_14]|nr:hypothetical protein F5I97DRAFT_1160361 [Phlebopus sp. FC_14]